ncbi:SagB/ThcOx family dehydrogenase [Acidobacteria bacterium AH-259-A15]|nr:SagB/ThcOx family dehydrogenase [Acidobacteria bacterium AH-259-A15]
MRNKEIQAAWSYHNQTKHSPQSIQNNLHFLDWSNQPIPFKIYSDLEPISLPQRAAESRITALAAISQAEVQRQERRIPDLNDLTRIFYYAAGITKRKRYPGGEVVFRAASCTGALYEIELYLVCEDLPDLAAGVYHFGPSDFALRRLRQGDFRPVLVHASAEEPSTAQAPAVIICTGTYWRNAWKYQARTYRHFGWDGGTILANLLAMCKALELPARLVLGFMDDEVNRLLDLETDREVALFMVPIGRAKERPPESHPSVEPLGLRTVPLSEREVDYPEMCRMHDATCLTSPDQVKQWRGKTRQNQLPTPAGRVFKLEPSRVDERAGTSLEEVIRRRGSSRQFERKPIQFEEFSSILRCSAQGIPSDLLEAPEELLNDWYLIVHAVEGLPSGAYVFHRDSCSVELLQEGNFRNMAGHLALGQALAADASFDVFFLADLDSIFESFGNRGYRAVQLEAGILGGKLYLAAYAQRRGATGLTFFDDDVTDFFSPHAKEKGTIFLMALGQGTKRKLVTVE